MAHSRTLRPILSRSYPFELDGLRWRTVEQYFQAQKFAGTAHVEAIRQTPSPMVAARVGRSRARLLRSDWELVKVEIMLRAVRAKFAQHAQLAALLLSTGDALIVEHLRRDSYWGDGGDGSGANRLGHILMQARARSCASDSPTTISSDAKRTLPGLGNVLECALCSD